MVAADLHVHTTNSDGTFVLPEVPSAASDADLDAVAVTDHDRLHPDIDAPVVERDGVTLIHGIELRVDAGEQRLDLLGYGARQTTRLADEIERLQRDRVERGRAILDCIEERLDVSLPVDPGRGLGRPEIARAVIDTHDDYDSVGDVFDDLVGNGEPCYVARDVPDFDRGRELLADACAVVSLAHPLRYSDPDHALSLAQHLDAVELHYPYGARGHTGSTGTLDASDVRRTADRHDLLVTGGSDAHGQSLGDTGLDTDDYERFETALRRGL